MVCMKSSTGVTSAWKRSFTPAHTPSGMPTSRDSATAVSVRARVSMLSSHSPNSPKLTKPAAVSRATRRLPTSSAEVGGQGDDAEPADHRHRAAVGGLGDQALHEDDERRR